MPRAADGTYTRTNGVFNGSTTWQQQAGSADKTINSGRHDTHDQDIADAMTDSLSRSGKGALTANVSAGGFKIENLGTATSRKDAVNAGQVQDNGLSTLTNVAGTGDAVTANATPPITAYTDGQSFQIELAQTNTTAGVTIAINGLPAIPVKTSAGGDVPAGAWASGAVRLIAISGGGSQAIDIFLDNAYPPGQKSGMEISNNTTNPNTEIDFSVGTRRSAFDTENLKAETTFTKAINASWVAGTGNGGLSSSLTLTANTWYFCHAINITGVTDFGFDTSPEAANLFTDHSATAYRRVGAVRTDATSNILGFFQTDTQFWWKNVPTGANLTNPGTAPQNITLQVPLGIETLAVIMPKLSSAGNQIHGYFYAPDANDQNASVAFGHTGTAASPTGHAGQLSVKTNTASQIRFNCSFSDGTTQLFIPVQGWIDYTL